MRGERPQVPRCPPVAVGVVSQNFFPGYFIGVGEMKTAVDMVGKAE